MSYIKEQERIYCNRCMRYINVYKKTIKDINKELRKKGWLAKRDEHICPPCSP